MSNIKVSVSRQGYFLSHMNVKSTLLTLEILQFLLLCLNLPLLLRRDNSTETLVATCIMVYGSSPVFSQNRCLWFAYSTKTFRPLYWKPWKWGSRCCIIRWGMWGTMGYDASRSNTNPKICISSWTPWFATGGGSCVRKARLHSNYQLITFDF